MKLMQEVAWALTYAHQRGVIHRDVKPDNIMIEQGTDRALVTDFGIALGRLDPGGGAGEVIGTARYMSPEQAWGEPVDARSDLYSLGATFFYAVSGRAPIEGKTLPAILARQAAERAPAIRTLLPDLPAKLAEVIDRSLRKAPDDRWPSGDEVAKALDAARGRHLRAPPLIRSFVRNAEVTTMVVLAGAFTGAVGNGVVVDLGPGLIGSILIIQLIATARRLLREGYSFDDIRPALLAEAQLQDEEAEELRQRRWLRWLNAQWHRLWAGRFGRAFFRLSGFALRRPTRAALPSTDATEVVLGRSTMAAFEALTPDLRRQAADAPAVIERLEERAIRLRAEDDSGPALVQTVDALENLRLAMLRLEAGLGSVQDLTDHLNRAKAIGEAVDRRLAAQREVDHLLGKE
jgi:serine/threonine-protein kinase